MKIQAFIFNWKGHEANAAALEEKLVRLADVTVVNSPTGWHGVFWRRQAELAVVLAKSRADNTAPERNKG